MYKRQIPCFADQPANADALSAAGLGVSFRYPLRTLTAPALREAVERVAPDDSPCRAALARAASRMAAEGGAARAVELLLSAGGGPHPGEAAGSSGAAARLGGAARAPSQPACTASTPAPAPHVRAAAAVPVRS